LCRGAVFDASLKECHAETTVRIGQDDQWLAANKRDGVAVVVAVRTRFC